MIESSNGMGIGVDPRGKWERGSAIQVDGGSARVLLPIAGARK
jgi:hypothetical protein